MSPKVLSSLGRGVDHSFFLKCHQRYLDSRAAGLLMVCPNAGAIRTSLCPSPFTHHRLSRRQAVRAQRCCVHVQGIATFGAALFIMTVWCVILLKSVFSPNHVFCFLPRTSRSASWVCVCACACACVCVCVCVSVCVWAEQAAFDDAPANSH